MKTLLVILTAFSTLCFSADKTHLVTKFSGKAFNAKNEHVFTEEYTIKREGDKIVSVDTVFKDPKGSVIADMASDFSKHAFLPKVHFEKKKEAFSYGSNLLKETLEIFKTTAKSLKKSKTMELKKEMVAGPGFYFYVLDHLDDLISGKQMKMTLVQPNRLASYSFTMRAHDLDKETNEVTVTMVSDSKLLKAFIPDIKLVLDAKEKTLISYEGLSGFLSDGTDMKKVRIDYSKPSSHFTSHSDPEPSSQLKEDAL